MGFISAFIVSACVVPPVVVAITYIAQTGNTVTGALAMFSFGLGMGFPLLLLGLSASWLLPKVGAWMITIQRAMGVLLLSAAIWLLDRLLADAITLILWTVLAITTGLYLILKSQGNLGKALGALTSALAGAACLFFFYAPQSASEAPQPLEYEYVESEAQLAAIIEASAHPVIVDYYAEWCVSCKAMEKNVFSHPDIHELLSLFKLVKIDITDETHAQGNLRRKHGVIGPPSFLFYSKHGTELTSLRVVGEIGTDDLKKTLEAAL